MYVNRDAWRMCLAKETYKKYIEYYEKEKDYRKHVVRNISSGHLPKANKGILLKIHSYGKIHSYSMILVGRALLRPKLPPPSPPPWPPPLHLLQLMPRPNFTLAELRLKCKLARLMRDLEIAAGRRAKGVDLRLKCKLSLLAELRLKCKLARLMKDLEIAAGRRATGATDGG